MAKKPTKRIKRTAASSKKAAAPIVYSKNMVRTSKGFVRTGATSGGASPVNVAGSSASQSISQSPLFYDYRWSTPDKFYFPRSRAVANRIWREIYMRDPAVATATDAYSELPWSQFDLIGIDDGSIRKLYEDMFNDLNLVPKFQGFTRDYIITGELILHHIFNSKKGYWERVISHNPDYVRVEGIGLAIDQPLLWLRPTPEIKRLINSPDPRIAKLRKLLPKEVVSAFRVNKDVPLDSLNTVYIPRLATSSSVRGVSLYTRLFRIVMYEDFIVNASLAVAQRNAAPLRIFKLGDPNTGWLPDAEDEAQFAEMLSVAESDPMAAIIMHHNVSCELVGVSDRVLLISREWDFIERVKLLALGMAKSFLVGESSFASAIAGLQTLLERLAALRYKFEHDWLIQKLCKPVAEMNEFYKRTQSELEHRIRIQKPEQERELIVPKIKWHKGLEPAQDTSILNVWDRLYEYGIISRRTFASGAGIDLEQERKNIIEEAEYEQKQKQRLEELGVETEEEEQTSLGPPPGPPPSSPPPSVEAPTEVTEKRKPLRNPYVEPGIDIVADLEELADSENRLDLDDVINLFEDKRSQLDQKLSEVEKQLPPASVNLLTGD